ncbi:MAG: hypothetical protein GXY44_10935 [Phycisphaerales bacterium]|nr:hypothetical protein [Phycisphaerales bacterium]
MEVDQLVEDALRRWSEELAQINRLIEYEGGRFPLTIAPNPLDTLLPHLSQVRTAARLKSLETIHRIVLGDMAYVRDDIEIMFTLGRLVEDEPSVISALVRIAVDALTVSIIEQVCAQDILEPDLLRKLEAMLAAADLDSRLYWGILGERALFVESFRWMRSDAYTNELDQEAKTGLRWGIYKGFLHDQATGLVFWNRYVQAVQAPSTGPRVGDTIGAEVSALPDVYLITKMVVPDFGRAFVLDMKTTSQIRAARTAMALERYRIAHGRWPDTLDKLVPEYLASIPLDPFDGRPLRYSLKDDAAFIYSISENLVDNSGEVASFHPSAPRDATDCGFTLLPPARRGLPADEADSGQVPAAGK